MPQYTVYLPGGGSMQVNASSPSAALGNAGVSGASLSAPSAPSQPQFTAPTTTAAPTAAAAPSTTGEPTYNTINGPKTLAQMQQELFSAGWGGATGGGQESTAQQIINTYASTTGGGVQLPGATGPGANSTIPGLPAPPTPPPAPATPTTSVPDWLSQFFAQTSGVTQAQLAQQKAEFDAQLAFAREQMEKLGIPQLQINQRLAALQEQQFQFQMAQATAGMTGMYQGQPTMQAQAQWAQLFGQAGPPTPGQQTEAARQFNAQLAQQYLSTAAQLQGPQNTFQLSNYLRGAQGNPNVPTYLQSLASGLNLPTFQAPGTTAPTPQTAAGLAQQLGGGQSATPGWNYGQTLGTVQQIMQQGAQALRPGALESLTPAELQAFGSGLGALGGSLPEFLRQYAQSRYGQQAPVAQTTLA